MNDNNGVRFELEWIDKNGIKYLSVPDLLALTGHMRELDYGQQRESIKIFNDDLIKILKIEIKEKL